MKRYLVFIQDEWNNLFWLGEYKNLNDSLPDINDWLKPYNTKLDEIFEYSSTFGPAFDTEIEADDDVFLMVRGFILEDGD